MDESNDEGHERIARRLSRAGLASRRDAERMILAGRVTVNGRVIESPALDVLPSDRIEVDGKPLPQPEPARLWLYHKPAGLVTSARDEKGRPGVFDSLPEGLPRVMSVGRLDLTSEGLLLLTNDGALKRQLELPSTGWLRKYRARVNGSPDEAMLEPLRKGIVIEGERFQPMEVAIDRIQGANAWLTVALREGRNREVRRAMEAVGLVVNRLIRISYGPFRLGELQPGEVEEVKAKVLREQVGGVFLHEMDKGEKPRRKPANPRPRLAPVAAGAGENPYRDPSASFRGRNRTKPGDLPAESVAPARSEPARPARRPPRGEEPTGGRRPPPRRGAKEADGRPSRPARHAGPASGERAGPRRKAGADTGPRPTGEAPRKPRAATGADRPARGGPPRASGKSRPESWDPDRAHPAGPKKPRFTRTAPEEGAPRERTDAPRKPRHGSGERPAADKPHRPRGGKPAGPRRSGNDAPPRPPGGGPRRPRRKE